MSTDTESEIAEGSANLSGAEPTSVAPSRVGAGKNAGAIDDDTLGARKIGRPIAEAVNIDVDESFHIRDEGSANWVLRKIIEARAYREHVARWAHAETLRADREEAFLLHRFGTELETWARAQIGKQHGRRRSIALPAGVVGFRQEPTKLLVLDERALVGWCRAHLPIAIKVTESLLKSEIQSYIKQSGEVPAGAEIGGGSERFYIK